MQMIADKHREYKEILSKAKASAQAELLREVPAVDAQTKAIFDADLIQLRGNIMFGTTPERSAKHLAELVEKASVHPSLAKQVQEEYLQLGAAIAQRVGHSEQGMKLRNELLNGHNKLNKATKADGYEEAQRSLADIAEMENVQFISNAKYDRVFSEISGDNILKQFANDSERYFDVHRERVLRAQMQNPDMQGAQSLNDSYIFVSCAGGGDFIAAAALGHIEHKRVEQNRTESKHAVKKGGSRK